MGSRFFSGLAPTAKQAVVWLLALVVTTAVTVLATSYVTRNDNSELAIKNQQYEQLKKFEASGEDLDTSFRAFNDALSDNSGVDVARERMRAAISQHAADTYAYQSLLGTSQAHLYMSHLAKFRDQVDLSTDATNAMPMAQTGLDIIAERRLLIDSTEIRLGIKSDH